MEVNRLRRDELQYELRVRGALEDGTVEELRTRLRPHIQVERTEGISTPSNLTLNPASEIEICSKKLDHIVEALDNFDKENGKNEHSKIMSRILHIGGRLQRITDNEVRDARDMLAVRCSELRKCLEDLWAEPPIRRVESPLSISRDDNNLAASNDEDLHASLQQQSLLAAISRGDLESSRLMDDNSTRAMDIGAVQTSANLWQNRAGTSGLGPTEATSNRRVSFQQQPLLNAVNLNNAGRVDDNRARASMMSRSPLSFHSVTHHTGEDIMQTVNPTIRPLGNNVFSSSNNEGILNSNLATAGSNLNNMNSNIASRTLSDFESRIRGSALDGTNEDPQHCSLPRLIDQPRAFRMVSDWKVKFDGRGNVNDFIEKINELQRACGVSKSQLLQCASILFEGSARSFYLGVRDRVMTWDAMVEELRGVYLIDDPDKNIWDDIRARSQGELEPVVVYIYTMEGLFNKLTHKPREEKRVKIIRERLLPRIFRDLVFQQTSTVSELIKVCQIIETNIRHRQRFIPPPTNSNLVSETELMYRPDFYRNSRSRFHRINTIQTVHDSPPAITHDAHDYRLNVVNESCQISQPAGDQSRLEEPGDIQSSAMRPISLSTIRTDSSSTNTASRTQVGNTIDRQSQGLITCFNCRQLGHINRHCPRPMVKRCYGCGRNNFTRLTCPECSGNNNAGHN